MAWLIPFANLTAGQQSAVQMDTRAHKAIIGGPGAGKTLVLLHRLNLLYHRTGQKAERVRLFVYTNTLKQFIRAGNDMLDAPDECISTFDKWCADAYREHVSATLPHSERGPDFDAIRAGVFHAIDDRRISAPLFDHVLVDEAQDLDTGAIEILKRIAGHITICMDGNQQLYEGRMSEPDALAQIGLSRHNAALLAAFRCNPMVTQLAAQFIPDESRREAFLRQASNSEKDRAKPLLYLAGGFDDEKAYLIDMVRLRLSYGDSIAVLFPQQRQVHGFANGFAEAGIDVAVHKREDPIDFTSRIPKLMTYHQAKGLTFDSVFLPRLDTRSFTNAMQSRIRHLLFVGVTRAIKWVFMTGENGRLISPLIDLGRCETSAFLQTQMGAGTGGLPGMGFDAEETPRPNGPAAGDDFGLD